MIHYYKRSLLDLFKKVQILRENPLENRKLCLSIQETLIKKITYIEKRIRTIKQNTKVCKRELLTNRSQPSAKEKSIEIKGRIKVNQIHIKQYQSILSIFRDIGDALAFIYIDKFDLKPMSFKQPSGFISGKKGSRLERKCLRVTFEIGGVALLNDLNHCLRYGDITVPKEDFFLIFEMKSGRWKNVREERQLKDIKDIYEYLTTDRTDKLYKLQSEIVRISAHSDGVYYTKKVNSLIDGAVAKGVAFNEVEKGLMYILATRFEKSLLDNGIRFCSKAPILAHLNQLPKMKGYYPFTLSIRDAEALYNFYDGELNIIVAVDRYIIEKYFDKKGYDVRFLEEDDWVMEISQKGLSENDPNFKVSWHFFGRIPYEFLSLRWFLDALIHMMESSLYRE